MYTQKGFNMPIHARPNHVTASALAALLALAPLPLIAADGQGVADPTVSWGLASVADWETAMPFLDITRTMRPFAAFRGNDWENMSNADLRAAGALDANGFPTSVPKGMTGLRTVWAWDPAVAADARKGIYVLSYEGRGNINLGGLARVINKSAGRIIFENETGGTFWMDITALNAQDPLRNLSIVRAEDLALAQAGALFNPDWLAQVADARELRFMDWMQTNGATISAWADRPLPSSATWAERGIPVEIMVRLANEAGVDPWFTMPHVADDDYIRNFATYVRDNLDPRLKAHVEYSNETWNAAFGQFHWLREQAVADWGNAVADDWEAIFAYHTKRATHAARIWEEVYGDAADDRLINVLGTQATFTWLTEVGLAAKAWQDREPDAFIPPSDVFEELAATTYFGVSLVYEPVLRSAVTERAAEGEAAYPWLYDMLAGPDKVADSVPGVLAKLTEQRDLAHANNMRFTAYEGGQHVHHSFAVEDLTEAQAEQLTTFLGGFVRSPDMAALYSLLWDGWAKIGDGPFMHYTEMGAPSKWGSWGLLGWPGDNTPRARFVLGKQAEGGSWWGEGGGPQYLQGVTTTGSEAADRMDGTPEEDFLAGLGGDDSFPASPGRDGINGGDGVDVYLLPGAPDAYAIAPEGAGFRVDGPDGSAFLIHVEAVEFGDGSRRDLK